MKILIISNNTRTINHFRVDLIKELVKKNSIHILARNNDNINSEIVKHIYFTNLNIDDDQFNFFSEFKLFFKMYKIVKSIKPDVGILFTIKPNLYGSLICKYLKIKCISNIFGLGFLYLSNNKIKNYFFKKILHLISYNSNKILIQNTEDKKLISQFTASKKLVLLNGSGIDTKYYKDKIKEETINYDFTYIGRIIKDKGINEFIEAAISFNKIDPKIRFCIQGENYSKRKDRIINIERFNYAINNKIIKYLNYGDVVKTINESKWIVLPSYREGSSRILQESISMGKPCLASNVPGCNNVIIDNFNGFLFEPKNSQSIVKVFLKTLNLSNNKYKIFSNNCLQFARNFDNHSTLFNYKIILEKLEHD